MARIVPARYRGIIRPDPRLTWWDAESGLFSAAGARESALGEASPVCGIPVPSSATDLALRASGTPTAAIEAVCTRSGVPVLDGLGYLWRLDGEADAALRGCDLPPPLAAIQALGSSQRYDPHVIALSSGVVLCCHRDLAGAIYVQQVSESGPWGAEVLVDGAAITDPNPCLLQIPDSGRILLYRWADLGADHQIRCWHSDDDGATWTADGPVLLDDVSSTVYPDRRRLRAVYLDGIVTIFGHLIATDTATGISRDRVAQWASSDGGAQMTLVVASDGSDEEHSGARIDACVWRGEIVLARIVDWIAPGVTTASVRIRRIPSGWYPWTSGDDLATTAGITSGEDWGTLVVGVDHRCLDGELALWADDVGALYLAGRHATGAYAGICPILRSADGGETWLAPGSSLAYAGRGQAWWWTGVANETALSLTACAHRGRAVVVHTVSAAGVPTDYLYSSWLGGWQSVPMPSVDQVVSPTRRTAWHHVGTYGHDPVATGWTLTSIGAPVITRNTVALSVATAAGESVQYGRAPAGTLLQGVTAEWGLEVASGTATMRVLLQDATPRDFDAEVRVTPATVELWDLNAAARVGATYTYAGGPVAIRIDIEGDNVVAFARSPGDAILLANPAELCASDRPWTEVARTAALVAGGGAAANLILWRTEASSSVAWWWWCYVSDAYCGDHLYTQPRRQKMTRSLIESPSWAGRGVLLSSVSGPAYSGDAWDVSLSAEYPYAALLPSVSPSPRHGWRSPQWSTGYLVGAVGPTARLSWQVSSAGSESTLGMLWGVLLDGLDMGGAEVWLYYAAAWHLAGSVGTWRFTGQSWGRTVEVTAGGLTYSAVLRRDELAGCLVELVNNAGDESLERHVCVSNDPGHIDTAGGTSLPLRITLATAPAISPGNYRVYPRRALLLIDLSVHASAIRGIQVRWPVPRVPPATPTPIPGPSPLGRWGAVTVAAGPVWAWGTTHGDARRLATEADTELITAEDGTRIAYSRSPARRRWSVSWSDLVAMIRQAARAPDYIAHGAAGPALAFLGSTPTDLADQLRALSGSLVPIVYCPSIDSGGSGRPDHWADGAMVCRITSAVERDTVVGDEERDEADRVQELVLEEEV